MVMVRVQGGWSERPGQRHPGVAVAPRRFPPDGAGAAIGPHPWNRLRRVPGPRPHGPAHVHGGGQLRGPRRRQQRGLGFHRKEHREIEAGTEPVFQYLTGRSDLLAVTLEGGRRIYVADIERTSQRLADRAFAGTGDSHHDVEASVHDLSLGKSNRVEKTGA